MARPPRTLTKPPLTLFPVIALALLSFTSPAFAHAPGGTVPPHNTHAWNRWETTLTSVLSYSAIAAYQDVVVRVDFTPSTGNGAFSGYAYWDGTNAQGKNLFKIRALFPQPAGFTGTTGVTGSWSWVTPARGVHPRAGLTRACTIRAAPWWSTAPVGTTPSTGAGSSRAT
jgi:hypothetical protein